MSKKVSKSVMEKIKAGKVQPLERWLILLKRYSYWFFVVFTGVLAVVSVSVMWFLLATSDMEFIVESIPYFWIIVTLALGWLVYFEFRHTEKGYKYRWSWIVGVLVAVMFLGGGALYASGLAKKLDDKMIRDVPFYERLHHMKMLERWGDVERGFLGGKILEIRESDLALEDFKGKEWEVLTERRVRALEALLQEGNVVKIEGDFVEDGVFRARNVRPWKRNLKPMR